MPRITFAPAGIPDDSGYVYGVGTVYPPSAEAGLGTEAIQAQRSSYVTSGEYTIVVGLVRFDTSALPDTAIITAASLLLAVTSRHSDDNLNLVGEFYPVSDWEYPLGLGDYTPNSPAAPILSVPITTLSNTGVLVTIPLTSYAGINLGGYTGFRLHTSGSASVAPAGINSVFAGSFDQDPFGALVPTPQLIVDYIVIVPLEATVAAAGTATATLQNTEQLSAIVVGTATVRGGATYDVAGTLMAVGTVDANLDVSHSLQATATAQAASVAVMMITHPVAGFVTGIAVVAAPMVVLRSLDALLVGAATVDAGISHTIQLTGQAISVGKMDGGLAPIQHIAAVVSGQATTNAVVLSINHLSAVISAAGAVSGLTHGFQHLIASVGGTATTSAPTLSFSKFLAATLNGRAVVNVSITHIVHFNSRAIGQASTAAQVRLFVRMRSAIQGQATVNVFLTVVPAVIPPGPPIIHLIDCEPLQGVHAAPGCTPVSPIHAIVRDG